MPNVIPLPDRSSARRTPKAGAVGLDGKYRRGGEYEPFYVPRRDMPQVDEGDMLDLISYITKQKCHIVTELVGPDRLLFHQRVDESCVPPIDSPLMNKPLLVSAEGYVLDGNHRATAHKRYGTRPVVLRLHADFTDAMRLLFSFPKTYTYGESNASA